MRVRNWLQLLWLSLVVVCGFCTRPTLTSAQWANVAPKLLGADPEFGAIASKDGAIWAGLDQVYISRDTGKTWTIVDLVLSTGIQVTDIACFDGETAIVATTYGAYLTRDGGATFTTLLAGYALRSATFGTTSSQLAVADALPDHILTSTDGGASWSDYSPAAEGMMVRKFADGTLASQSGDGGLVGDHISLSSDFGKTWHEQPSSVDFDSYNFVIDPCNDSTIYLVNEQVHEPSDSIAKIYISTDRGLSWTTTGSAHEPYYSGAMAITPGALYLGTTNGGVLRSTDKGKTWNSIGGPRSAADSRSIVAIDENILLAISPDDGSIWLTGNSGGSKLYPWSGATPLGLLNYFDGTPATSCGAVDTSIYTVIASCTSLGAVTLVSDSISGSSDFRIDDPRQVPRTLGQFDSVHVFFDGGGNRIDTSVLHVRYSVGSVLHDTSILLIHTGNAAHLVNSNSDGTIHATANAPVSVPIGITVSPSLNLASINVDSIAYLITYDANVIDMISSKARSLTSPRSGWTVSTATSNAGLLRVTLVNTAAEKLTMDSLYLATEIFTAFQSSQKSTVLHFGDIELFSGTSVAHLCAASEGDFIANVAVDASSVAATRSASSAFELFPNPAIVGQVVRVQWSDGVSYGGGHLVLVDVLGRVIAEREVAVTNDPIEVPLPDIEGTYYLRMEKSGSVSTRKLIVR